MKFHSLLNAIIACSHHRQRLARELLALSDYDTATHVRTMELLKLRFGEAPLHACEVRVCTFWIGLADVQCLQSCYFFLG